jgi:hypothetical protein
VGVDANLTILNQSGGQGVVRYPPLPHGQNVAVAAESGMIALRKRAAVEVWRLGKGSKLWTHCSLNIKPGVDVMITIFCYFWQFSAKKLKFFSKTNVMMTCFA